MRKAIATTDMKLFEDKKSGAEFSECGKYRYALWRIWDDTIPSLVLIGLNPSTANQTSDDPTIKRVRAIARHNGYGGIYMLNLFALVSAFPEELLKCYDPIKDNDKWLSTIAERNKTVVFAWGNFKVAKERAKEVIAMFPNAFCLQINKNGTPKHPLYCKVETILIPFTKP